MKINKLHLIYTIVIFLLLITFLVICWVLSAKCVISEYVFDNFAFAATLVSIVLAIVSIVYTIYSGAQTTSSIGVLENVENNITKQLETLQGVENVIKETVKEEQSKSEATLKAYFEQGLFPSGEIKRVQRYKNNNNLAFDIDKNTPLGNVFLYCCLLSKKYNKPWKLDMPAEMLHLAFAGYMAALKAIPSIGFVYKLDKETHLVSNCDFSDEMLKVISIECLQKILEEQSNINPMFVDVKSRVERYFVSGQ